MGYSEVYCHLCGISFNVGRIRRSDEPNTAAWTGLGGLPGDTYIEDDDWRSRECKSPGCMIALRRPEQASAKRVDDVATESEGEDSGSDYVDEEMDETEPYEFNTPPDSIADEMDIDTELGTEGDSMDTDDEDASPDALYQDLVASLSTATRPPSPVQEVMLPRVNEANERPFEDSPKDLLEHIAGPDCRHSAGYNGNHISAEEMRGCYTSQVLVPKPSWWRPEPDDEEFEATTDVFLSGLNDCMPSRDWSDPTVIPPRHGCSTPRADNIFYDENLAAEIGMPFHPTCLEVFKRASLWRTGEVNIQDLTDWYRLEADSYQFFDFPRDPAVSRGREQMWRHNPGDEFLAANPCFLPNLGPVLEAASNCKSEELDYHRAAFDLQDSDTATTANPTDLFARLPPELRFQLLSYLGSKDIGNLRLVSRAFRQLPQSFFHQLLLRNAPWLWEAWSHLPYSYWATTTASELRQNDDKWQEEKTALNSIIYVLAGEGGNEAAIEAVRAKIAARELAMQKAREGIDAPFLPKSPTDWRQQAADIATRWDELKGLRNRARIWRDCEEILDRIERQRASGRMGDGVVVDARATCQAYFSIARKRNQAWHNYCKAGRPGGRDFKWEEWVDRES